MHSISFAGREWKVKTGGPKGPGPNLFSADNVSVDDQGLRLQLRQVSEQWLCASVQSLDSFGYGMYAWRMTVNVGTLDPSIVLGMFQYPTAETGPDGTHEIDIEIISHGVFGSNNLNFGFYPTKLGGWLGQKQKITPTTDQLLFRYRRGDRRITFECFNGHIARDVNLLAAWSTKASEGALSYAEMPVIMNLWLFRGMAPANGKNVEVVCNDFFFDRKQSAAFADKLVRPILRSSV